MIFDDKNKRNIIPSWIWIFMVSVPVFIFIRWLIWWFFCPSYKRTSAVEIDAPRSDSILIQIKKDDFNLLKGIGPKTAEVLYSAGVFTYKQMGLMEPEELDQLLSDHSLPTGNRAFWQKQAILAAAQDWEGLKEIQK